MLDKFFGEGLFFLEHGDLVKAEHKLLDGGFLVIHDPVDELDFHLLETVLGRGRDTLCLLLTKERKSLRQILYQCYPPSSLSRPRAMGQQIGQNKNISHLTRGAPQQAIVYLWVPVEQDMGTTSATTSTTIVEKRMAAQSGMRVWMTRGRDSRTIALPTRRVVRKRWWSWTTPRMRFAIWLALGSELFCIIYRLSRLRELSPTVIPEQNPPPKAKTMFIANCTCGQEAVEPEFGLLGREVVMPMLDSVPLLLPLAAFFVLAGLSSLPALGYHCQEEEGDYYYCDSFTHAGKDLFYLLQKYKLKCNAISTEGGGFGAEHFGGGRGEEGRSGAGKKGFQWQKKWSIRNPWQKQGANQNLGLSKGDCPPFKYEGEAVQSLGKQNKWQDKAKAAKESEARARSEPRGPQPRGTQELQLRASPSQPSGDWPGEEESRGSHPSSMMTPGTSSRASSRASSEMLSPTPSMPGEKPSPLWTSSTPSRDKAEPSTVSEVDFYSS